MRERPFSCPVCGQSFRRQEHLNRHATSHNSERRHRCQECSKSFARRDTLNRHAMVHRQDAAGLRYSAAIRACQRCASKRIRCSRGAPCNQCDKKGLVCLYAESPLPETTSPESNGLSNLAPRTWEPHGQHQANAFDPSLTVIEPENVQISSLAQTLQNPSLSTMEGRSSANADDPVDLAFAFQPEPLPVPSTLEMLPFDLLGMTSGNHLAAGLNWWVPNLSDFSEEALGQYTSHDWQHGCAQRVDYAQSYNPQPMMSSLANRRTESSRIPSQSEQSMNSSASPGTPPTAVEIMDDVTDTTILQQGSHNNDSYGRYYVDGTAGRVGLPGAHTTTLSVSQNEQEPFERNRVNVATLWSPNLKVYSEKMVLSAKLYTELVSGLRTMLGHDFEQTYQKDFPASSVVASFLGYYFDSFHLAYPLLRRVDFKHGTVSWVVVLAAAAMGAHLIRSPNSDILSSLLAAVLSSQPSSGSWFPSVYRPQVQQSREEPQATHISTIQATILHTILVINSSAEDWISRSLMARAYLVECCERMDLLEDCDEIPNLDNYDGEEPQLRFWLQSQTNLRAGLMIWLLDTMLAYQTASAFRLTSLKPTMCLPVAEAIWETSTPEITRERDNTCRLTEALDDIWIHKRIPSHINHFSCTIIVLAICRRIRDIKSQDTPRLLDFIMTASAPGHRGPGTKTAEFSTSDDLFNKWRNSACDSLDVLHWETNSKIARCAGWEPPCILYLHLSRLLILAPVSHLQLLADDPSLGGSKLGKQRQRDEDSQAEARLHITRWALQDCFKARLCLIHAGALYWYVRRFRVMGISEAFGVYLATLVLWAYSTVGRLSLTASQSLAAGGGGATEEQSRADQDKDPQALPFIYLDRPCDDEMVQTFVRGEHGMTTYIHGVGDIRASDAANKILSEGQRILKSIDGLKSLRPSSSGATTRSADCPSLHKRYIESLAHLQGQN